MAMPHEPSLTRRRARGRNAHCAVVLFLLPLSYACDELTEVSVRQTASSGSTSERGDSVTLEITLADRPSQDLEVFAVSSNEQEGVASSALLFVVSQWQVGQAIRVTGADDTKHDGDQQYEVRVYARASRHPSAGSWLVASVPLVNRDDETLDERLSGPAHQATNRE